jgi:hypothetical protein
MSHLIDGSHNTLSTRTVWVTKNTLLKYKHLKVLAETRFGQNDLVGGSTGRLLV